VSAESQWSNIVQPATSLLGATIVVAVIYGHLWCFAVIYGSSMMFFAVIYGRGDGHLWARACHLWTKARGERHRNPAASGSERTGREWALGSSVAVGKVC
jgi:hypothetical protein